MKRLLLIITMILLFALIFLFLSGCISNPRIKGYSAGVLFLNADLGYAGEIKQVVPVFLVNIEGD